MGVGISVDAAAKVGVEGDVEGDVQEDLSADDHERLTLALRAVGAAVWDWDLAANKVHYAPQWQQLLGDDQLPPTLETWLSRVHPDDASRLRADLHAYADGEASTFEAEYRLLHRDGACRWMQTRAVATRHDGQRATRIVGMQQDVTFRKATHEQLLRDAFHDAITGLPNRALFLDRLGRCFRRSRRQKDHLFAVLLVDIDRFKIINNSLGHEAGDRLLIAMARRLEDCIRAGDSIARVGDDEFVVILDDLTAPEDVTRAADRIQAALGRFVTILGQEVTTTSSIGIALSSAAYERPEDLLRDADTAMHRAKAHGRGTFEIFDRAMHEQAIIRLQLEQDLRHAIELGQLRLVYQPIIDLTTRDIVGFEALLRWKHPVRGPVSPVQFIPVAEESGLIVPMGQWVLSTACHQMQEWQEQYRGTLAAATMSVNLSSRQFSQPNLSSQIAEILEQSGLPPQRLKVELTESAIMEQPDSASKQLTDLRRIAVGIAIDDFGTGYSSLAYLHRFPLDTLKVDRSFVSAVAEPGRQHQLVRAIIALAHNLDMTVVAEGIEKADQLAVLDQLGCDYGQGYLFAKPIEVEDMPALLADRARWQAISGPVAHRPGFVVA